MENMPFTMGSIYSGFLLVKEGSLMISSSHCDWLMIAAVGPLG